MSDFAGLDAGFWAALSRSLVLGAAVLAVSLAVGWPLGVAAGIWRFPAKRIWLHIIAFPLLLPSFLISIGLSMLWRGIGGFGGVLLSFSTIGIPLVLLAAYSATLSLTNQQADAARLAGRESHLFRHALRAAWPLAGLSATLAAVMTLADPGPGQILGFAGAGSELLITFAARYDRLLATKQALIIALAALLITGPLAWKLAPLVSARITGRAVSLVSGRQQRWLVPAFAALAVIMVALPLLGLFRPLAVHAWPLSRAWREVTRTTSDTLLFAALAAAMSVIAGFGLASWATGHTGRERVLIVIMLVLFALPPCLYALWLVPWSHPLTLGLALGLRCLPVAALFGLRAHGSMPNSWSDAARVHRVPRVAFFGRVVLPWISRWGLPAAALAVLISTAEVGTVLLLHPPGRDTLPLAIFTIMANAPEALVALLCLLYVSLAGLTGLALSWPYRNQQPH